MHMRDYTTAYKFGEKAFRTIHHAELQYESDLLDLLDIVETNSRIFLEQGNIQKALSSWEFVLDLAQDDHDEDNPWYSQIDFRYQEECTINHSSVARVFDNIASIYEHGEQTAIENAFKALDIKKSLYGDQHIETAYTYCLLAKLFFQRNDEDNGNYYMMMSLRIINDYYDYSHPISGKIHYIFGKYIQEKSLEISENHLLTALQIQENIYPCNYPDIAETCLSLSNIYEKMGDTDSAIEYKNRANNIYHINNTK